MLVDWESDEWRRVFINVDRPSSRNAGTMKVQYTFSQKQAIQKVFSKSFAANAPESTSLRGNKSIRSSLKETTEKKLEA